MVERLRGSAAFVPGLSLVAEVGDQMVGHILLTKIRITGSGRDLASLALAPLSVVPEFRDRGVGKALVIAAHRQALELGFGSVVVVGISGYYPQFGYRPLPSYGLKVGFEARETNCFAIELVARSLGGGEGLAVYPPEWMGQ